ncbi:hypothetical protein K432DRAFT_43914 [Lepidopterella palustris CBS 459.81]|uniref:Uncharacterized protein n=1 Tax=Lepidopterella palustris CBS 459.81 TaxID=1314670 RepID=A0A8E2JFA6_9PEZI|nr:hypothetical protein K432DRAFT_43914 [Lepidopterella palustris CBS 459.81]
MSANEKNTFGATAMDTSSPTHLSQPNPPHLRSTASHESNLSTIPSVDSTLASKTASQHDPHDPSNPFSAFYKHPDARRSMDAETPSKPHLDVYQHDLESGVAMSATTTVSPPKVSVDGRVKECTMWPSKQTMMERAKARKRERGGLNPMRNLSKKQKLWAKIFIALFIVAAAVGLGVGISRAVGGGVWAGNGKSKPIPGDNQ